MPKIKPIIITKLNFSLKKTLPTIHTAIMFETEAIGNSAEAFSVDARNIMI